MSQLTLIAINCITRRSALLVLNSRDCRLIYLLSIKLNQFLTNLSNGSKLTQSFYRCFSCQNPVHQGRCQPSFRTFTVEETRFTISGVATSPRSAEVPARKESVFNLLPRSNSIPHMTLSGYLLTKCR